MRDGTPRSGHGPARTSTRPPGWEWRAARWLTRHPLIAATPLLLWGALTAWGTTAVVAVGVGLAVAVPVWWRAHPPSFDRFAAPRVRAAWRRWGCYRGGAWRGVLEDCDLTRDNRRTGRSVCPRVLRVRSATPSIDTVYVAMARGQDLRTWVERADALAHALFAHRVAVTRRRPGVVAVTVERTMPFDHVLPARAIPADPAGVDLSGLDVGDDEYGRPFLLPVRGRHVLVAGASGAGKGSLLWGPLRAMGPLIRDGLVRVHMVDLKGGAETARGAPLFHRYATTMADAVALLTGFRDGMLARQRWMRENGVRRCEVCPETPLEILTIDELAMLTAYGSDRTATREALRLLAEIMTQGRASLFTVIGYIQEPSKDVLDVRELFTVRICLGVTAASHVDMVLGEGARERGALADEIPGDERHAGIGFVIDTTTRVPVRFRAAYVTDDDITELVDRCAPDRGTGELLTFPDPDRSDEDDEDGAA